MAGKEIEEEEEMDELGIDPGEVELDEVIGEGTTATVYIARMDGKEVAVKEIRAWKDMVDHDTVMAVERELSVLSQADHPHILRFLGLIRDSEPLRLVFEYCAGGSLFELLHNRWDIELSWMQRLKMLHDSALAMDYLHSFEPAIIHRDLKSLNLMLLAPVVDRSSNPHIKLGDFGFARAKEREMTQGVGTKHWMAPEVLRTTAYTEKADVFSYAMVAFEVICRHVPFESLQPIAVAKKIGMGERPTVEDHVKAEEVPEGLVAVMESCWAQDPLARPTFRDIAASLGAIMARSRDTLDL
mmetsp:Transcript_103912/g.298582  ORF Transcript_103912/g.298582 Transcript_103912/m.298582 type:complete len:299 (+) Transcript_103912:54-950(+)|eukprot:CAMPEP_0177500612 /NCGR_PEP_ID=MMETSP0369-20130122/36767_1 /TAXON_ID=447022 ORGANISM="Scrippsiella hangoei-like, Strain SHHI-4" /NCGR_SAMPLE_ID=MMETSP0369 /ASSEMBLY_ACC=CAM_ASM_000364 /LENGTH=298 /DNA_ID=CAMNT_0018978029 /DNA_START=49 /DNA_END=945 /DNA_ORIENTATION=+